MINSRRTWVRDLEYHFQPFRSFLVIDKMNTVISVAKNAVRLSIGWPDEDQLEDDTITMLKMYEKIGFNLLIFRRGYAQIETVDPHFDQKNSWLRGLLVILLFRILFLITLPEGIYMGVMGDVFFGIPNRRALYWFFLMVVLNCTLLREYILHLEGNDALITLRVIESLVKLGSNPRRLKMSPKQSRIYLRFLNFLGHLSIRLVFIIAGFGFLLLNFGYLSNEWTFKVNYLLLFDIAWTLPSYVILIYYFIGNCLIGMTLIAFMPYM